MPIRGFEDKRGGHREGEVRVEVGYVGGYVLHFEVMQAREMDGFCRSERARHELPSGSASERLRTTDSVSKFGKDLGALRTAYSAGTLLLVGEGRMAQCFSLR